ncbi:MAG: YggS family pyridoxal phosphate-dependent enzyme [Bdellovibrionales bacterium]|nr:YggS family pyridoxal phosphate-dependent enzyme [Bdellovibrionales bacterium]
MDGALEKNLERIQGNIAKALPKGCKPPRIVAVSKHQPIEKIKDLYELGIHDFAENYWQEAAEKIETLKGLDITWHFIGSLQRKKMKDIVGTVDWIHSMDRIEVAEKISEVAQEKGLRQKVLLQVNVAGELSKMGIPPKEVMIFLHQVHRLPGLEIRGLMVFPPLCQNDEESLKWFEEGRQLFELAHKHFGPNFSELSMGTSHDYALATQKGATMLRIGESLMGVRI